MLKQVLIYCNSDLYKHGCLDLGHQRAYTPTLDMDSELEYYINQYKNRFNKKEYSELHILTLLLDPANGETTVLVNEYSQNPLKVKTIINAVAATAPKKIKKISFDEMPMPEFDDPDVEHDDEEEHE